MTPADHERIGAALLARLDVPQGVVAIGIGDGELFVYVRARGWLRRVRASAPESIEGLPVRVRYVGAIRPARGSV